MKPFWQMTPLQRSAAHIRQVQKFAVSEDIQHADAKARAAEGEKPPVDAAADQASTEKPLVEADGKFPAIRRDHGNPLGDLFSK